MLTAITGNISSGKTTFAGILEKMGFEVFYSDEFVFSLYKKKAIASRVRSVFGPQVFRNGSVDKKLLAQKAFSSQESLHKLESIIHPQVRKKLKELRAGASTRKIVFAEIPVLFEAKMEGLFDKVILVKSSNEAALARSLKKGLSKEEFSKRSAFQLPASEKEKRSDFVVNSECSVSALREQAEEISMQLSHIIANGKTREVIE